MFTQFNDNINPINLVGLWSRETFAIADYKTHKGLNLKATLPQDEPLFNAHALPLQYASPLSTGPEIGECNMGDVSR
jgi:hypothetical protein